jgi:hypothetical protein
MLIAAQPFCVAQADPEGDSQRLAACIAAHFTPADSTAMAEMTALLMVDSQATNDDVQATFDSKRPEIFAAIGKVLARYAEQDCATEVRAAAASLPAGGSFKVIFQNMGQLAGRALGPAMTRISMSIGLELLKSMDTKVALDIFGPAMVPGQQSTALPQAPPGSAAPSVPAAAGSH